MVAGVRPRGYLCLHRPRGHAASRLLRQQRFDLVITDIIMPDGDGLELILELKRAQPSVPILAISGCGRHLQATDCLKMARNLGARALLLKPFNREQMLAALRVAVPTSDGEN